MRNKPCINYFFLEAVDATFLAGAFFAEAFALGLPVDLAVAIIE
jgi:hypothetical protein